MARHRRLLPQFLWILLLLPGIGTPDAWTAAPALVWKSTSQTVNADIPGWPVSRVLESVAAATGWQVYLEPEVSGQQVATRFRDLRPAEALRHLLGGLSFALLPQTNAPAKLFVFRSSVQAATQPVRPPPPSADPEPIPNELVVRLKPGAGESIENLAKRLGAKIVGRLDGQHAYRLQFASESAAQAAREELADNDDVASTESNYAISPPSRLQPLAMSSAGPISLKPKVLPNDAYTVVALLDTPVTPGQAGIKDFLLPSVSVTGSTGDSGQSDLTHGTAMVETILRSLSQAASDPAGSPVRILPVDIYGGSASTTTFEVVRGLYAAAEHGPAVVNLSLGSSGDSPLLRETVESLAKQGVLVVAAAGNEPVTNPTYPAAYSTTLAVTAGDRSGQVAAYANRGTFVDLVAPGTSIVHFDAQTYLGTGTSYATAYITGAAAGLFTAAESKNAAEVEAALRERYGARTPGP